MTIIDQQRAQQTRKYDSISMEGNRESGIGMEKELSEEDPESCSSSETEGHVRNGDILKRSVGPRKDKHQWDYAPFTFEDTESRDTSKDTDTETGRVFVKLLLTSKEQEWDILKTFDNIFSPPELSSLPELNEFTIEGKPYLEYLQSLE